MLKAISLCALLLAVPAAWGATLTHDYDLTSSFNDQVGSAALVSLGGSIGGSGYTFAANQGLNLSSALSNIANYSILVDFSFQTLSSFRKIIDPQNLSTDNGLYELDTGLAYGLTPVGLSAFGLGGAFTANTPARVIVTRDSATQDVFGY